jgi:hypothetical protein
MLKLLRRYLRLMRTHDFSYSYTDDFALWQKENMVRINLIALKATLSLVPRGQWFVKRAEKKYGYV